MMPATGLPARSLSFLTVVILSATVSTADSDKRLSTGADVASLPSVNLQPGEWLHSYSEAMERAQSQGIPVLLHFEASWCGPCRTMKSTVLNTPDARSRLGTSVIGVRIDADRSQDVVRRFGVATLPTEILLTAEGRELRRFTGATSLSGWLSRLDAAVPNVSDQTSRVRSASVSRDIPSADIARTELKSSKGSPEGSDDRSCLIVHHNGQMVGLGGYCPVSLITKRDWIAGSNEHIASWDGVDYYFRSAEAKQQFEQSPERYIPHLHGCDLVELKTASRMTSGAIEYGSFYQGRVYFFASIRNRELFQKNPRHFVLGNADSDLPLPTEDFPFIPGELLQ